MNTANRLNVSPSKISRKHVSKAATAFVSIDTRISKYNDRCKVLHELFDNHRRLNVSNDFARYIYICIGIISVYSKYYTEYNTRRENL